MKLDQKTIRASIAIAWIFILVGVVSSVYNYMFQKSIVDEFISLGISTNISKIEIVTTPGFLDFASAFTIIIGVAISFLVATNALNTFQDKLKKDDQQVFTNSIRELSIEQDYLGWNAALDDIQSLALRFPKIYCKKAYNVMINLGKQNSVKIRDHQAGIKFDTHAHSRNQLVLNVISSIYEMSNNENCRKEMGEYIEIESFYMPYGAEYSSSFIFHKYDFKDFIFFNCDLEGVVFKYCSFENTFFSDCCNINLMGNFLCVSKAQLRANEYWEKTQFNMQNATNFIYKGEAGWFIDFIDKKKGKIKADFLKSNIMLMESKEYFYEFRNKTNFDQAIELNEKGFKNKFPVS